MAPLILFKSVDGERFLFPEMRMRRGSTRPSVRGATAIQMYCRSPAPAPDLVVISVVAEQLEPARGLHDVRRAMREVPLKEADYVGIHEGFGTGKQ